MKNKNKTLKRLTATFLTATSVFNFTVLGKAKVVNFQPDGSIQYGENGETISNKQLEEIRKKIKEEFEANKLGREYHSKLDYYNTTNFTTKGWVNNAKSDDNKTYTDYRVDKELIFKYNDNDIKSVYIIYSVDGSIEKWVKERVEDDKNERSFNQFDSEHKDSIFLVIAPDAEWEKMKVVYEQEDVQNKFIRFGRIVDTNETVNLTREVGIPDTQKTKTITDNVTEREIRFIDPTSPQQQQQQQQSNYNDNGNGNDTNKVPIKKEEKKSLSKPLIVGCGIFVACLISIPVIGPMIEQYIKDRKTKVNIKKTNTNINTHTNK